MFDRGLCTARGTDEEVPQVAGDWILPCCAGSFMSLSIAMVWVVTSTKEQWAKQARELFTKRLYEQAAYCFFKADMSLWKDIATAYGDRQAAQKMSATDPRRHDAFRKVAQSFYSQACEAQRLQDQLMLYANAARCFVEAKELRKAAKSFALAQKYDDALWYYKVAKSFDEALELISLHPLEVDPVLADSIKYTAKIVFTTKQTVDDPASVEYLEKAAKICNSTEEYINFLEDHGFMKQLVIYYDRVLHQNEDAAEVFERNLAHAEAVTQWLKAGGVAAQERAASCLLDGLRREVPYGTDYRDPTQQMKTLLKLAPNRPPRNAVERESEELLQLATETFPPEQDIRCSLLCLDAWSSTKSPGVIETADHITVTSTLKGYLQFSRAIRSFIGKISRDRGLVGADDFLGFLGFDIDKQIGTVGVRLEGMAPLRVLPRSVIYGAAIEERPRHPEGTPITISRSTAVALLKKVLIQRCNEVLLRIHDAALHSRVFNLFRLPPASRALLRFDTQIQVHCLIIAVLDHVAVLPGTSEEQKRKSIQGIWLSKLFETCHPSTTQLGSFADIVPSRIPADLIMVVKAWLEESASNFQRGFAPKHLLNNVLITTTLSFLFDHQRTFQLVDRSKIGQNLPFELSLRFDGQRQGNPIAPFALAWFSRKLPSRHLRAILFIEQVVKRRVHMDVTNLTAFIEDVSAQLILNHYYHGPRLNYNGMVMPRSWFLRALVNGPCRWPNGTLPFRLLSSMYELLRILYCLCGGGYLSIMGQSISNDKHWQPRMVNVKRICRAMCLVGYNCRNEALVEEITKNLGTIQSELPDTPLRAFQLKFAEYRKSKDWSGVFDTIVANSPCAWADDLVGVWHHRRPVTPPPKAITEVLWHEISDLIGKVSTTGPHQSILVVPAARNSAVLFVPPVEIIRKEASVKVMQAAFRRRCSVARDRDLVEAEEPPADKFERQKESVKILEAFYLRHQKRPVGGPPAYDAFDKLASRPLTD
ncbi:hypothetical protein FRB99_002087, partial [Tulasnella sp. 403]